MQVRKVRKGEGMNRAEFYLEDLKTKFAKIDPAKYYLAYSGGKDSGLLHWFLKTWLPKNDAEMGERYKQIPIIAVNTGMEFPEILERMKQNADKVLQPKMRIVEVIEKFGTPCFSKEQDEQIDRYQRGRRTPSNLQYINGTKNGGETMHKLNQYALSLLIDDKLPKISMKCCINLKHKPFEDYEKETGLLAILGLTTGESQQRDAHLTSCFTKSMKFRPLWDLDEETENEIYELYNIPLPTIYAYVNQTGCAGCPYGIGLHHTEKELALMTPAKRKYVQELFKDAYRIRGVKLNEPLQTNIDAFLMEAPSAER